MVQINNLLFKTIKNLTISAIDKWLDNITSQWKVKHKQKEKNSVAEMSRSIMLNLYVTQDVWV